MNEDEQELEEDEPYCRCGNEPMENELDENNCFGCGRPIA